MSSHALSAERFAWSPTDRVIVCHPERLVGAAAAATLEGGGAGRAVVVTSLTELLSRLSTEYAVAVVFDSVDELHELFDALRFRSLPVPVLVVSEHPDLARAVDLLERGAAGSIAASCTAGELCSAVQDVLRGRIVFLDERREEILELIRQRRSKQYSARVQLAVFTEREQRVLAGLVHGASVTDIARRMCLSPHTVRAHVQRIAGKLGTRGQLQTAAVGRRLLAAAGHQPMSLAMTGRGQPLHR